MLRLSNVRKDFGDRVLFERVSFCIGDGERVGLVGANGSGKSTLLQLCAGLVVPDEGAINLGRGMAAVYLPQIAPSSMMSGGEVQRAALVELVRGSWQLLLLDEPTNNLDERAVAWLEERLRRSDVTLFIASHDRRFLDNLTDRTIEIDAAMAVCTEYGGNYSVYAREKEKERALQWRMYAAQQTKVKQLKSDIGKVKEHALRTELVTTNDYLRGRSKKVAAKAKARETRLMKMLSKENKCEKPRENEKIRLTLSPTRVSSEALAEIRDGAIEFGGRTILRDCNLQIYANQRILLMGENGAGKSTLIKVLAGEIELASGGLSFSTRCRVGYLPQMHDEFATRETVLQWMVSTLERLSITALPKGSVAPSRDELYRSRNGDTGSASLNRARSGQLASGALNRLHSGNLAEVRTYLHRFLFSGDDVFKPVTALSCGERMRLKLASIMAHSPNLILLDEPTNHLDLESIESMEGAFEDYDGALVFVSHDRTFQDSMQADLMWIVEDGRVREAVVQ